MKWIRSTWDSLMRSSKQFVDLVIFGFHGVRNTRQIILWKWKRILGVNLLFFFIGSPADMPTSRRMERG
jgi:hypothetical protein